MLLTVDIGNTNIIVGCFKGDKLICECRLCTDLRRTRDEYNVTLVSLLQKRFNGDFKCAGAVIASVVPPLTTLFSTLIADEFGIEPLIVGPGVKTGVLIKQNDPAAVGSDRIANAVAAKCFYGLPALVVDFGTATTIDYIDSAGSYIGGVIAPGLEIALDALVSKTAKLPRIERVFPDSVIGRNTVSAMQAGTMIGYECLIAGLIERFKREIGEIPYIISTGGLGSVITERLNQDIDEKITYDPDITIKGMLQIWLLNQN